VRPSVLFVLSRFDVVRGKHVVKSWRWVLILCLVFGMFASPPVDMVTMFLVAGIMFVLYMLAACVCLLFDWRKKKRNPELFVEYT